MRAHRRFRPVLDFLPTRLAPSTVAVSPMDPTSVGTGSGSSAVSPMDPTSTSSGSGTTYSSPGSYVTPSSGHAYC
ncbi:MAG: hypothetical protein U0790_16455 [Isosphaeraceae bacterium]